MGGPEEDGTVAAMVTECQCPHCQREGAHPDRVLHWRMNALISRLDEAQRRWYVALESQRSGHGGDRLLAQITGLDEATIRRGRAELQAELAGCPEDRVRQPGAGGPSKKTSRASTRRPSPGDALLRAFLAVEQAHALERRRTDQSRVGIHEQLVATVGDIQVAHRQLPDAVARRER